MATHYDRGLRTLHWLMFALVAVAYITVNMHELFPRGSTTRANMLGSHFLAGVAVFLLVWPRLRQRKRHGVPPIVPAPARWSHALAGLTHLALYAFLIVQPLLGLVTAQYTGKKIALFGVTVIPQLVTVDRTFGHRLEDIHGLIGEVFYWVIGLHILAALWHHAVVRDNTLTRMLPPAKQAS